LSKRGTLQHCFFTYRVMERTTLGGE
jgi:hypothetical protein